METYTYIAIMSGLLLLTPMVFAHPPSHPSKAIKKIIAPLQKQANIAIIVTDLKNPKQPLLSINESIYMQPASAMKVLNAIIASESLHPKTPFTTQLYAFGEQNKDTLTGDIYLEIGGNPSFSKSNLIELVQAIKSKNIKKINGNIIILKTHFDDIEKVPGTVWDEVDSCYATAVSDVSLDKNCFLLTLLKMNNHIVQYSPQDDQPTTLDIEIAENCNDNSIANTHYPAHGYGIHLRQNPFLHPATLSGCWSKRLDYIQLKRSISHPDKSLIHSLRSVIKQQEIQLTGRYVISHTPPPKQHMALWRVKQYSEPLETLIRTMLVKSDNHIANQLYKESAYQSMQKKATWENAQHHAQKVLSKYQLHDENGSIVDGAGLSRNNRVTADQLHRSLIAIYRKPKLKHLIKHFTHSKDEESLLRARMQHINPPIYAKTGYLNGVTSIMGYIDPFGNHPKAFTIIINGNKTLNRLYLNLEPSLMRVIAE